MQTVRHIYKILALTLATLVVLFAAAFAIANRTPVSVSLSPLPFELTYPLGTTILVSLALGLIIGSGLMSFSRLRLGWRARRNERRAAALEKAAASPAASRDNKTRLPSATTRTALGED